MSILANKIDFAVILSVKNANPNGDPLNGNRPRETYDGIGEISDVCIKRKIRNRLMDMGQPVFVQSDDKRADGFKSLKDRADSVEELKKAKDRETYAKIACEKWMDVRSFGQVFAFKGSDVSTGVRGPVSVHPAFSVDPIDIASIQITKSVNSITGDKKSSDTMGMKHSVPFGVYVFYGSINCQLAEKTGFTEEDTELIRKALVTLFENDSSSARPDGSMEVCKLFWWKHNCKTGQYSSAKVHRSLHISLMEGKKAPGGNLPFRIEDYYDITADALDGLKPEIYDGI
ncbi:type I-C CRISPR-associated protein Cas7/Csd2 [Caproiciproducens sp.]|uniref:type I-C CRISPR-associated protein Cas7/Csd2 n=1 Tax=Caproiciproducens sp. TaxID=1954376 RepID=UPI002897891A|nr:type I-C CRISPR-associated protein Cas7/Csd2 [Caproiciproducens sp.]